MISVLKLIPRGAWLALALAAIAGAAWLQYQHLASQRDAALSAQQATAARLEKTQGEVAALESALEWRREHAQQLRQALEAREHALAEAEADITDHRDALRRLESEDAEVDRWGAAPVPAAVADWLRELRDDPHGTDPGDAERAASPDIGNQGPRGEGDPSPGSPGAAR